jgi:hypothetical protein
MNDLGLLMFGVSNAVFSPQLIEFLNGSTFVLHISMAWFFGEYTLLRFHDYGFSRETYDRVDGPLSVTIVSIGCAIVRGSFWLLRFMQNRHMPTEAIVPSLSVLVIIGAAITVAGGVCAVRVFANPKYGKYPWVTTFIVSMLFGALAFLH